MDKKDGIKKYRTLYTCLGMCVGMAIGSARDKRLSENMMKINRIETMKDLSNIIIYVIDKNGIEKEYRVTEKKMKEEKFSVDDRLSGMAIHSA